MEKTREKSSRLHYLDWLQVLSVLGVFIFHALFPFSDLAEWNIKSTERSTLATLYSFLFAPWGMPFFFLMAGATSWFSLRRRTARSYIRERVTQLLIPFIVGAIVLTPIQAYYELTHRGWWEGGSFVDFILSSEACTYFYTVLHPITADPKTFSQLGYHLWFVAFLFVFSLIALPIFTWLKGDSGKRFVASLAKLAKWRGALLVFVIPLILFRFVLQPFFPDYTSWSDFAFMLIFFISGYIIISDEQFMGAIRKDWLFYLIMGIACSLYFFLEAAGVPVLDWMGSPGTPAFYLTWTVFSLNSWCWAMIMFYVGMRFLDYTNKWLRYSREASFFFFWIHHPVTLFTAFYALQWDVDLPIKMLFVLIGSFVISLGTYEFLVRRINPVRAFFGMKPLSK
ncbi:acyltransferase family protein [Chloroflexota bacterium]